MNSNSNYMPKRVDRILASRASKSRHAVMRQGRAITDRDIRIVTVYGERSFDNKGGERFFMSKSAIKAMANDFGRTQLVERLAGVYVVITVDGQTVITVGHYYN